MEVLTRDIPYPEHPTAIEAAILIAKGDLVPTIPVWTPSFFASSLESCFKYQPNDRPTADQLVKVLSN